MPVTNSEEIVINTGNVYLVDPNKVNVNPDITNSIPQYQDMHIFAELTAERRSRTVLVTGLEGTGSYSTQNTGTDKAISVNFLGNNQDPDSPNYLNFTTNWYDGSTGNRTQFEGFGIGSIKVAINSSFVPQINIQFIDVRGLSFFNQADSPYRTIFDFPPPIFYLTVKGYYGKALKYQLHLVKYTTEFIAQNGNFVIDAQFIAITYAPLTDVLFRYVVNFPLIEDGNSMNPNPEEKPKNTYELIMKLRNLYSEYSSKMDSDIEAQTYKNIQTQLNQVGEAISILNSYKQNETLTKNGNPFLIIKDNSYISTGGKELTLIQSVSQYDEYIKSLPTDALPNSLEQRLFVTFQMGKDINIEDKDFKNAADYQKRNWMVENVLKPYRVEVIKKTVAVLGAVINENDIPIPKLDGFTSNQDIKALTPNIVNTYVYVDVTNYYFKLYKLKASLQKSKIETMTNLNDKINAMVIENLGMKPTIYNVFELILNDVDTFFRKLRRTSWDAEKSGGHHEIYKNQIINDNFKDVGRGENEKIYSFPLIIKQEMVCNQIKEARTAPIDLSSMLPEPFPEMKLIEDFINTFLKQQKITELFNMRAEQNEDGTFKWIPISPVDSKLATSNLLTPYFGVDSTTGGSDSQPINISSDKRLTQIYKKLLDRFYILSQNALATGFYDNARGEKALVEMHAKAEAVNLAISITNKEYTNLLYNVAQEYGVKGNIQGFYDYIKDPANGMSNYYTFTEAEREYFKISNGDLLYANKYNDNYQGYDLYYETVALQTENTLGGDEKNNSTPIAQFQKEVATSGWKKFLGTPEVLQSFYKFTEENVFYIKDGTSDGGGYGSSGINTQTHFLATVKSMKTNEDGEVSFFDITNNIEAYISGVGGIATGYPALLLGRLLGTNRTSAPKTKIIEVINTGEKIGNYAFPIMGAVPIPDSKKLQGYGDIVDNWSDQLSKFDADIYDMIIDYESPTFNSKLSALMILSNFGYTLSPFNTYPYNLNELLFNIPAAVETPQFVAPYMGALVDININDSNYSEIYEFFVNGTGKNLDSSGVFIFADIIDINGFLADADKTRFQLAYNAFYGTGGQAGTLFFSIIQQLKTLYNTVKNDTTLQEAIANDKRDGKVLKIKKELYAEYLGDGGRYFPTIIEPLISRMIIVNFSQLTFDPKAKERTNEGYFSLETTNADIGGTIQRTTGDYTRTINLPNKSVVNDNFFKTLFLELSTRIKEQENKLINVEEENKKLTGDEDIITQTYYSFKNINDKWLTGPKYDNPESGGYPTFSKEMSGKNLIDSFVFVDRAMNPIGNTIINPEILTDMLDNQNVSVFSVITQLLSLNGFEFFPLQNFMTFSRVDEWKQSFAIDTEGAVVDSPTFVCMYVGGGSSYPSGIEAFGGNFKDDGIIDISNPGVSDFSMQGCETNPDDDDQVAKNPNFPWRQVRAFRVRFGEQNQSMFTNIKIDSKEYPETNESIQILSRLAGDNKLQAPAPKGQNLYNLYENRSYSATVDGLGNVMIQPTQYFQVENVPLYNGAYIILNVEHNIEPNKMTTRFSGTKLLKYPVPRVLQASAIVGFEGGNTDQTSLSSASAAEITSGVGTEGNPTQAHYNSMYEFKIQ